MAADQRSASDHPETWKFDYPIFHAETRDQWRRWLQLNHDEIRGVWLCSWRSGDRPRCPYPDAVEEAICFGWIDSTAATLDEERGLQLFTPRKAKSSWSRLNRQRVANMQRLGLMTDAGRRAVETAKENGWWTIYDQVEADALKVALDASPPARANWDQFPPSARKQMPWWVISAAKEDTRARRIQEVVSEAALGRRALS